MIAARRYHAVATICLMMMGSCLIHAQDLNNQTNIFIGSDVTVHFDGSIRNGGFIQHQGALSFTGDWSNSNIYQGTGTVFVVGDRAQSITNNRQSIYRLIINGTGNKSIAGRIAISSSLQLLSGIVVTTSVDTLLLSSAATVSDGSAISYVDGPLFSEGVGYKFFPIGKNGNYNPVELNDVSGINPVFSMEAFVNTPDIQAPSRTTFFRDVYWKRTLVSGTYGGSPATVYFDIPDRYTDSHVVTLLQSDALDARFTMLADVSITEGNLNDAIATDDQVTANYVVVGSSIPIGGVEGEFFFSNSLSPKASLEGNRSIKIFGNQLEPGDFLFQVYNRWGLLVFESTSLQDMIDSGWNGTMQGGDYIPAGAYPYVFKATKKNGERIERKGVITIVY
ncbi:T9SS type B sorting domain-containing protein [Pseudochryseolinea flava]|uniref:Gliding motility-associated C-terminal domain-containing protein n=1 Tax=Pseudochryseolinea flava TaxID=2059302 RepID=A0A364XUS0_9BACT|nr:gliding motility-associated C-terminal domain-containing protein [Pseudochryseolinea flava]RAV97884.1 hypothetical protein DQQ10_26370 [Pseudochryseolinea flava]